MSNDEQEIIPVEYVDIESIYIPSIFTNHPVSDKKIRKVQLYYDIFHRLDKPITLFSSDNRLMLDGYARFVFALSRNLKEVPVIYRGF
ncbi:hypothetical protein [Caproiciproducens sp. CPB-2]|uniref:hypothetical protein n=1 Tax=Caproiciproducens sp. CPB-2 TaxID=3030017 RepID=UPI0023DC6EBF|nr:hypothetical protein [Caproiciproducens sp. CPB-2]MDF1496313.1 hypothetical protein [Caproiciproducens sp. CPB-2]